VGAQLLVVVVVVVVAAVAAAAVAATQRAEARARGALARAVLRLGATVRLNSYML
jgi:hypothetical protein